MAAPALAASIAEAAICSGVTGTAGLRPGVSADPVTAHEIMTLRCMPPASRSFEPVKLYARSPAKPSPMKRALGDGARKREAGDAVSCHPLCTALRQDHPRPWRE